jgi:hypothetical protein
MVRHPLGWWFAMDERLLLSFAKLAAAAAMFRARDPCSGVPGAVRTPRGRLSPPLSPNPGPGDTNASH